LLLIAVAGFIFTAPKSAADSQFVTPSVVSTSSINPLDQLSSASIALTVARLDNLPETTAISNQADSETALLSVASDNNSVISKPQVVATNYVSNKDIKIYVVKPGDSVASIAMKFNISTNSILWSNNISGNYVTPGVKLLIPPISGIVYTVKKGDTPASLAQKYQSNESLLIAYNDAEIKGIYPGERIIISNGTVPSVVSYTAAANATYGWGGQASYGFNGYDFGYCTWWVAKLRQEAGDPLPTNLGNASTWAIRAQEFGIPVGTQPAVGAAVVTSTTAYYGEGHVAYVTAVHPNGTITISEMNAYGWDIVDTRVIPSAGYEYIY
jgi:surface antigen